jgi:hypothetical protein
MTIAADVSRIFADAREVYVSALERLEQGDIRDAAEEAWCATKRATDALILARTGEEPEKSPVTSRELRVLAAKDRRVDGLVSRYYTRMGILHGDCFYLGMCEPVEETQRRIRETLLYIQDAEALVDP